MKKRFIAMILSFILVVGISPVESFAAETSDNGENQGAIVGVSLGNAHSGIIKDDGNLWMCGYNHYGQVGNKTTEDCLNSTKVMSNVKNVSLGYVNSAAIKEDGSLWMWGQNFYGQLGNGKTEDQTEPIYIMGNVKNVSLGFVHSGAIKEDGSLWMWGTNQYGQLGDETTENHFKPIQIMSNVKSLALGLYNSAAIKEDGSLWVWGSNEYGQLGDGTTEDCSKPKKIMEKVRSVSLGEYHGAVIKEDGSLWMWGQNENGQLGNGTQKASFKPIKIMEKVRSVSLGGYHSAVIKEDGSLWIWGWNDGGQLGNGTRESSSKPINIMENVKNVELGGCHSAAIKEDGSLWMWGYNGDGELGTGAAYYDKHKLTPLHKIIDEHLDIQWGKDVFAFVNCASDFGVKDQNGRYDYQMNFSKELYGNQWALTDLAAMRKNIENWNGSCFGMTTYAIQNYYKNINLGDAKNLYQLKKPAQNTDLKNMLGFYQSTTSTSKRKSAVNNFLKLDEKKRIKELYDKVKNIKEKDKPVLVDFAWVKNPEELEDEEGSTKGWAAHSVLVYGIETEGAPYNFNGREYAYRIRTIDPNEKYSADLDIDQSNQQCIYLTKELDDFFVPSMGSLTKENGDTEEFPVYSTEGNKDEQGMGYIQFVTDDEELLPPKSSNEKGFSDTITAWNSIKFENENFINKTVKKSIYPGDLTESNTPLAFDLYVDPGDYTIQLTEKKNDLAYCSQGLYRSISSEGTGTVTFYKGNKIDFQNNSGDYDVSYTSDNKISKLGTNDFEIHGSGKNSLKISLENEGVKITGDQLKDLKITSNIVSDGEEKKLDISTSSDTVLIQEKDNGNLEASVDKDGDGKFETPVESGNSKPTVVQKKITYVSNPSNAVYTGKSITKSVTVKSGNTKLKAGQDYSISYSANKNCGKAKMVIKGKNNYTGTYTKYFYIYPKKVSLKKVTAGKKKATVTYKKASGNVSGYQIRYSRYKSFKKSKYKYTKKTKYSVQKLSRKKYYYIKVRAYKTVNGKKYYGAWSNYKKVKIK